MDGILCIKRMELITSHRSQSQEELWKQHLSWAAYHDTASPTGRLTTLNNCSSSSSKYWVIEKGQQGLNNAYMHMYMVRSNQSHTGYDLSRRGKEFVWQIHTPHSGFDKSNQSRLYLKAQPFEVSRKRKNRWWIFSIQRKSRSDLWKSRKMDGTRWQKYKQELVGKMSRLSQKCF